MPVAPANEHATQAADDGALDYGQLPGFIGYQIRRAQAWVFAEFLQELGTLDLTPGSFGLIALVRANPGITQNQLARAFGIDKSTLTPVLNRLQQRGLILREPRANDRRFNVLRIAPGAEGRVRNILGRVEAFETRMSERLGAEKSGLLIELLCELRGEPAPDCAPPVARPGTGPDPR